MPALFARYPMVALLDHLGSVPPAGAADSEERERILRVTERLLRRQRWLKTTCLYRALVRYTMLRRAGHDVRFVLGVRPQGSDFVAHAWLELDGAALMEEESHTYLRTFVHPATRESAAASEGTQVNWNEPTSTGGARVHNERSEPAANIIEQLRRLVRVYARVPRIPATDHLAERRWIVATVFGAVPQRPRGVDASSLLSIAERFALSSALAEAIDSRLELRCPVRRSRTDRELPAAAVEALRERRMQAILHNRLLLRDAVEIAGRLTSAGIQHVFLKGTALLARYPALRARPTDDIDLLVLPEDIPRVATLLGAAGYVRDPRPPQPNHPVTMWSPTGTYCEVHERLNDGLDLRLWTTAEPFSFDGHRLMLPSLAGLTEHLCHHVVVQHAALPRYLPRHLVDLRALRGKEGSLPRTSEAVATSLELLELVEQAGGQLAPVIAALLLPQWHTELHLALTKRWRRGRRSLREELRSLARFRRYVLQRVD